MSEAKPKISLKARKSIRDNYESGISDYLQQARKYTDNDKLEFDPNFEGTYAALLAFEKTLDRSEHSDNQKLSDHWQDSLGQATLSYFKGFVDKLRRDNFKDDDILREGFTEAVSGNVVTIQIVDKVVGNDSADCVIEDGKLILRTTKDRWWSNPESASRTLVDQL